MTATDNHIHHHLCRAIGFLISGKREAAKKEILNALKLLNSPSETNQP